MRFVTVLLWGLLLNQALTQDTPEQETEIEETEEDVEVSDFVDDWWKNVLGPMPRSLNNHDRGVVSPAIHQGAGCGACGQVSGVQSLEARIALVSENWVPYSIQNFMNCDGRVCVGTQPYRMATLLRKTNWVVPTNELPWTKNACKKWGPGTTKCYCGHEMGNYTNVLDDQFVFIGPTVRAETKEKLKFALQSGPATTCFMRGGSKRLAEALQIPVRCRSGCDHANSVIGYTEDSLFLQESYGKNWGRFGNGTWENGFEDPCGEAILKKAYFTVVFYDYDRANAYYEEVEVSESRFQYLKFEPGLHFTENDLKNIGTAKNRCAFLGKYCKGVFETSSGEIKLISSLSGKDKKKKKKKKQSNVATDLVTYFQKTQMVIYLHNDGAKTYIQIKMKKGNPRIKMTTKLKKASPFFTSYGRIISYQYPQYHLVNNRLEKIEGDIKDSRKVDQSTTWALEDCNLQNIGSGKSLALKKMEINDGKKTTSEYGLAGKRTDMNADSQRFSVGISGNWLLVSSRLQRPLLLNKKTRAKTFAQPGGKTKLTKFRWNGQQLISMIGKPFDKNFEVISGSYFKFSSNPDNAVVPAGCKLVTESDKAKRLVLVGKKRMKIIHGVAKEVGERWTLKRGQI